MLARGPGVAARQAAVHVLDVTPTILTWLGIASGADMPGRAAAFVDLPVPERIPTHDRGPIERAPLVPSGRETELLERLEALGYLE